MPHPKEFAGVTIITKANVYFGGSVVSHSVLFSDDSKKTIGLIYPGTFHFSTAATERMEVTAGSCRVKLDGSLNWIEYAENSSFEIPANSGFTIEVGTGIFEYICSFLS